MGHRSLIYTIISISLFLILIAGLLYIIAILPHAQIAPDTPITIRSIVFDDVAKERMDGVSVSPDYFRDTLRMIELSGKQSLFASEIVQILRKEISLERNGVVLTFDDGWAGNLDYAHPLLERFGMRATEFVHTAGTDEGRPRRLGWDDLQAMKESGIWEIHSHSESHADLTAIETDLMRDELSNSLHKLQAHGFAETACIAYPFGKHTKRVRDAANEYSYTAGFTAGPITEVTRGSDLYAIPRTTVCQLFDQELVCRKLRIDLQQIRREIAIYDEPEGRFTGNWETIPSKDHKGECFTAGQYGRTYAITNDKDAAWTLTFTIHQKCKYSFSIWTPKTIEGINTSCQWRIDTSPNLSIVQQGKICHRLPNGWTILSTIELAAGCYEFDLCSERESIGAFVVDALKVERG